MADQLKQIREFPQKPDFGDDDLLLIQGQETTYNIRGQAVKKYAEDSAKPQVELAKKEAQAAAAAADRAEDAIQHPAIPDSNTGNWLVWDQVSESYQQTEPPVRAEGQDFEIRGYYPTLEALEAAVPEPEKGYAYGVGTEAPYDIYVWDLVHGVWVNNGPMTASGDMLRSVYDPKNKRQDIFAYADAAKQAALDADVGRSMAGQTVEPTKGTTVTAADGAEIFNDCRPRTFGTDSNPESTAIRTGNVASGLYSHAEGTNTNATGDASHVEGKASKAIAEIAHAEGSGSIASGKAAHAEGGSTASGSFSHSEGLSTKAQGDSSHAEGRFAESSGTASHAEGRGKAKNLYSHAEGGSTASADYAHAEGSSTASGYASHAEGSSSVASDHNSHAEGRDTIASNASAHAEGSNTEASGISAHSEGNYTVSSGNYSHAGGEGTIAAGRRQMAIGEANVESTTGDYFIIGKGTFYFPGSSYQTIRANCFRVSGVGVYASGNYNSSGADYAELFEWADGNPGNIDRTGRFVTLEGENIRLAGPGDGYILGIVSGAPSVVGDVYDDQWQGMYLTDIFGRPIWEDVEVPDVTEEREIPVQVVLDDGSTATETHRETVVIIPAHTERRQKLNPDYDNTQLPYIPRSARPEWDAVGMLGKLVAVDDGTCQVNGWAAVGEGGAATNSEERTKYRVMARLDERHVRILIL